MKISTKGRYALIMLVDLAEHGDEGFVSLKDIAARRNISKKYLEQIVAALNKPDILRTNRGYKGGYALARKASEYTVFEILNLTEGGLEPVQGLNDMPAERPDNADSDLLFVWQGLYDVEKKYLSSITIADIVDHIRQEAGSGYDFII